MSLGKDTENILQSGAPIAFVGVAPFVQNRTARCTAENRAQELPARAMIATMLAYLRHLVARLRRPGSWPLPPIDPPEGPDVGVREPVWRRPSGGASSVAVAEPENGRRESVDIRSRS